MSNKINIAFCVNDAYAEYIRVTIKSICDNHPHTAVVIHILSDFISDKRKRYLEEIVADKPNITLTFYFVDDSSLRGLKDTWSIYTWYRVLLPSLLPQEIHRVLYLDADTLVTDNLEDLFSLDMSNKAVGCAIDVETLNPETFSRCGYSSDKGYVCAGVMLMNLDYWREHHLSEKIVKFGYDNDSIIKFPDQDTINILCQDTKIILPMRYGIQEAYFRNSKFHDTESKSGVIEALKHPAIIHYAGLAPWIKEFDWSLMYHRWLKVSKSLKRPVKPKYITTGINKLKVILWRITRSDPRKRLTEFTLISRLTCISEEGGQKSLM